MFYDDNNRRPENEGGYQDDSGRHDTGELNPDANRASAAPSGEYHFTRENYPGAAPSEQARPAEQRSGGYEAQNSYGGQNGGYGAQNSYGGQNGGYGAQNNYSANNGYGAQGGYNGQNGDYAAPQGAKQGRRSADARRTVPPRPTSSPVPPKPPRKRSGGAGKIVALALVCSLVGGMAGAGGVYALRGTKLLPGSGGTATVTVSEQSEGGVSLNTNTVAAGESMTPSQIYKSYADGVVCINISTSQGTGAGTGFVIDGKEGYVLTCYHVVDGAQSISVTLNDSSSYSATYVGGDKDLDCAIIKITPKEGETLNLKSVVLGDSSKLEVGESVCTIGNALGTLANTLTSGTVSALNRSESMEDGTVMNVLQTDTAINSGNSGGPLFNSRGEVIGIVNAKRSSNAFSNTASIEGIAFAIPISDVTEVMSDLLEHGYITGRPLLGVTLATITQATAEQYTGMVPGAYVRAVTEGSCAAKAGIQVGDIITSFDGQTVTSSAEVIELKRKHKAGDEVEVVVRRNGDDVMMKVTLDEDPDHDNPIDDGSNRQQEQGDQGYGFGYSYGDDNGSGGSYGFPFSFFGW